MKILFLIESTQNETAKNLISAFSAYPVDMVPYYEGGVDQCEIVEKNGASALLFNEKLYYPSDYDAVLLWCWGTAAIGRKYLRLFEDNGVEVLNSTYHTQITDSKIAFSRLLDNASIPSPKTIIFDKCFPASKPESIDKVVSVLGSPPYVLKSDYGTQGKGIQFLPTLDETQKAIDALRSSPYPQNEFILQEFIGDPEQEIFHYRVLVIGDQVLPKAIKATATQPMSVSNISTGGIVEWVTLDEEMKSIALQTVKASGLLVAGVDLMVSPHQDQSSILVLEVNDGAGTKTFDKAGLQASQKIVDFFVSRIESRDVTGINSKRKYTRPTDDTVSKEWSF